MTKFILSVFLAVAILVATYSCNVKAYTYKVSQVDSVLKIVNRDHSCGCNEDKDVKIRSTNKGKGKRYYYQAVVLKDTIAIQETAEKTRAQLIKLMPELNFYKWIYLEIWRNTSTDRDTVLKAGRLGTAYYIKNRCTGYRPNKSAKDLIKKIYDKKFEASLCKKE
jgi:hypothetical protein